VILDEPFSGLDPVNATLLKELVREVADGGRMVFFSSHQMSYVEEFCDDILIMDDGQIILSGNLGQIKRSYPRNRVLLVPENGEEEALERWIQTAPGLKSEIKETEKRHSGIMVTLFNEGAKQGLYAALAQTENNPPKIDSFRVVEPTLEEIFIEKAGRAMESAEKPETNADAEKKGKKTGRWFK
jgi:ABC-2 type transport system ATP-binding protein